MAELTIGSGRILTSKRSRFVEEGRLAVAEVLELELRFVGKELEARLQLETVIKLMLIIQHLVL